MNPYDISGCLLDFRLQCRIQTSKSDIYNPHLVTQWVEFICHVMAVQKIHKVIQSNKKQKDRKVLKPAFARAWVEVLDEEL